MALFGKKQPLIAIQENELVTQNKEVVDRVKADIMKARQGRDRTGGNEIAEEEIMISKALRDLTSSIRILTMRDIVKALTSGGYYVLAKRFISGEIKDLTKVDTLISASIQSTLSLVAPMLIEFVDVFIPIISPTRLGIDPALHEAVIVGLFKLLIVWVLGKKDRKGMEILLEFLYSGGAHLASDFTIMKF